MPGFRTVVTADRDVAILVRGSVTAQDIAYTDGTLTRLLRSIPAAEHARVKLAEYHSSGRRPLAVVQVNVELDGRLVRSQSTAGVLSLAVDRVVSSLAPRIRRLQRRLAADEIGPPSFGDEPWDRRAARGPTQAVTAKSTARRITRHKAFPLAVQDMGAATLALDLRDYDFHLFVEDVSGQDTVVVRGGAAGFRLAAARPQLLPPGCPDRTARTGCRR
ncbi:sigma 54 modulation/S30EA ribosomal C-terminal domain-containing protein [Paractinoplanes hotanensis]|uniref:Sigma 54 modulation/S30EA ribosomal C-terminal domain-containing protein n=1 Tax=Paractinoplanes hotanensis TaxID=2906497 RepID=A0ABT0Y5G4_9ACTN|nr:sigma 54 modulation/S30EA ribosomal C-terminal domain-containing protein [Actinoplanes hotanensis]MCM4081261.1 sigma 54 modulation/S30EA ribosomal C-terminal domain-containing protein [Actinoplanes hotanensis]